MKKRTTSKRVAAYLRVSDPSQVEKYSLDAQRADIERWCDRRGYQLVQVYVEEGKSARTERIDRRPKLVHSGANNLIVSCDQRLPLVSPFERLGHGPIVIVDEVHHLMFQVIHGSERSPLQQFPHQDAQPDFHLVHP